MEKIAILLKTSYEHLSFPVLLCDRDANIVFFNTAAETFYKKKLSRLNLIEIDHNFTTLDAFHAIINKIDSDTNYNFIDSQYFYYTLNHFTINETEYCALYIQNFIQNDKVSKSVSYKDELTKLSNKTLFMDRLKHAIHFSESSGKNIALLYMDIDDFVHINKSLGHDIGDLVIIETAKRISACVGKDATVSRFGGDEFFIMVENINDTLDISVVAQHILRSVHAALNCEGHEIYVSASIGISIYPLDGNHAKELIKNADAALHNAKEKGKDTFEFYTEELTQKAYQRVKMVTLIKNSITKNEFDIYFQPQIDLHHNRIIALEALIRWFHPDLGMINPDEFIPLTEDTGIINRLGEIVLEISLSCAKQWYDQQIQPDFIAVNISGKQLQNPNFITTVKRIFEKTACPSHIIEFEITESFLVQYPEKTAEILLELTSLGIKISIDDFGTGYSSLSYLKKLPVNKVKIDKSFIEEIVYNANDKAIVHAIIAMAKSLHIEVIAEGVETLEQKQILKELACDQIQGYLCGKPQSYEKTTHLLNDWSNYQFS